MIDNGDRTKEEETPRRDGSENSTGWGGLRDKGSEVREKNGGFIRRSATFAGENSRSMTCFRGARGDGKKGDRRIVASCHNRVWI